MNTYTESVYKPWESSILWGDMGKCVANMEDEAEEAEEDKRQKRKYNKCRYWMEWSLFQRVSGNQYSYGQECAFQI